MLSSDARLSDTAQGGSVPLVGDFPLEQSCDDTLHSAFDQVVKINQYVLMQLRAYTSHSHTL